MRVWIDADACPRLARDQVIKCALKRKFSVILVAGQAQPRPNFACVQLIVVPSGQMRQMTTLLSMSPPMS